MPYYAEAEFEKALTLANTGLTVHVYKDGDKFGRLEIGKAGVKWLPVYTKKSGVDVSWRRLAEILDAAGD